VGSEMCIRDRSAADASWQENAKETFKSRKVARQWIASKNGRPRLVLQLSQTGTKKLHRTTKAH
jgi:hypothetical protein